MKSVKRKVKSEKRTRRVPWQQSKGGTGAAGMGRAAKFFSHKQRQIIDMKAEGGRGTSKNVQLEIEQGEREREEIN